MHKTFDPIDIFFIVIILIYFVVLFIFIAIFINKYTNLDKPAKDRTSSSIILNSKINFDEIIASMPKGLINERTFNKKTKELPKPEVKKPTTKPKKKTNSKRPNKTKSKSNPNTRKRNYKTNISYVKNNPKKKGTQK